MSATLKSRYSGWSWATYPTRASVCAVSAREVWPNRHLALGGFEQPDDHLQQGGLARAVRADQGGYRAGRHLERAVT
jgi:hypothetical protein